MWCTKTEQSSSESDHFDLLKSFVSRLYLQTLVGGVTGPCIAECASLSDAIKLIIVSLETYSQVPSKDVETALFL